MISEDKLNNLLEHTGTIIKNQRAMEATRGETFNVFSILKMERLENSTHSAFITELLNPKGTHLKGNLFLRLFLEGLDGVPVALDLDSAWVKPEHHVGARDIEDKTGGRIDIYVSDKFGNCISIENKIDAGDQEAQIERYCNHNKEKNTVLYLTLQGTEPGDWSKGALESGTDFYIISYRDHILVWLDKCTKEAADSPILRETIKQYKILIQKLTSTMAEKETQELVKLMLTHFEEAEYIAENFKQAKVDIQERLRQSVLQKLNERLAGNFLIKSGKTADNPYSQIWIRIKGFEHRELYFGLESFSGKGFYNGALFVGIFNETRRNHRYAKDKQALNSFWINPRQLPDYGQYPLHLGNAKTIQKLHSDNKFKEGMADFITSEVIVYLNDQLPALRAYLASEN